MTKQLVRAPRQSKSHRQRAQEALDVATRQVIRLEKKATDLRTELAGVDRELRDAEARRLYLSQSPDLDDPHQLTIAEAGDPS